MNIKIISKDGKDVSYTNRGGKVRKLLDEKKAKVISNNPFTIQLLIDKDLDDFEICSESKISKNIKKGDKKMNRKDYLKTYEQVNILLKEEEIDIDNILEKILGNDYSEITFENKLIMKELIRNSIIMMEQFVKEDFSLYHLDMFINKKGSTYINNIVVFLDSKKNSFIYSEINRCYNYFKNYYNENSPIYLATLAVRYSITEILRYVEKDKLERIKNKELSAISEEFDNSKIGGFLPKNDSDKGIVLSKNICLNKKESNNHILVLGDCASGKTAAFTIPNLCEVDGTKSIVINDCNGDLYKKFKDYYTSLGMDVVYLNPYNDDANIYMHYNPILNCTNFDEFYSLSETFIYNSLLNLQKITGNFMHDKKDLILSSITYFASHLLFVKEKCKYKTFDEAINCALNFNMLDANARFNLKQILNKDKKALKKFEELETKINFEIFEDIKLLIESSTLLFKDELVSYFCNTPMKKDLLVDSEINYDKLLDINKLRTKPTALFVSMPVLKTDTLLPLNASLYNQLFQKLIDNYDKNSIPVLFFLDEFPSIGALLNFTDYLEESKDSKINVFMNMQSFNQLVLMYGNNKAKEIFDLCNFKLIFSLHKFEIPFYNNFGIELDKDFELDNNSVMVLLKKYLKVDFKNNYYLNNNYAKKMS